jgi:THO complex subunit 5
MQVDSRSASHTLINEPFLLSVLNTTHAARAAALHLLDVASTPLTSSDVAAEATLTTPPTTPRSSAHTPASSAHALSISRAQKPLFVQLSLLRSQNRQLAHLARNTKARTSTSRAEVDTLHLSLQNLYYESRHLAGEIAACECYRHAYKDLPLISEEEFLNRQPLWREKRKTRDQEGRSETIVDADAAEEGVDADNSVQGKQATGDAKAEGYGEEAFMKARIQGEMQDRIQLDEQRKKLQARKMELVKENAKRKEELGKLDKELEVFIAAAKPIQKTFETVW